MISAVVLTKNEENNIRHCLESLKWFDEVIIVDDESTDDTINIARALKAKTYRHPLNNDFSVQHNFGLSKAIGDWIIFVDADEVVSEKLATEIQNNINQNPHNNNGFLIKRLDFFWGKPLLHGETGNIKLLRLAKKDAGKWQRKVHETWKVSGNLDELAHPLLHYPHPTVKDYINSINHWTEIDAEELPKEGKKFSWARTIINPIGKFIQNYFFRLGFLDGWPGLVSAFMMSLHSLTVRVKMYEHDLTPTS